MSPALVKRIRLLASALSVLLVLAVLAGVWFYYQIRASLPQLDGTHRLAGLSASVHVDRDELGVPTVRGASRLDVARALGFLHAQDRFFQMDVLRRRGAGELAELFGKAALPLDRVTRPHRFRELSEKVLASLPPAHRALLDAYTAGVNAGLAALRQVPFEYLALRTDPAPWKPEDSIVVIYAMTLDLQDANNTYEHSLMTLRDRYGNAAVAFFDPLLTPDDAALDGTTGPLAPIPGPKDIDLRQAAAARSPGHPSRVAALHPFDSELSPGSNSFALTGAHTADGAALLANDPHLNLAVPNIWYRAVLEWPEGTSASTPPTRLVGVTIPGLPLVVLGSNGHIAWGLTDAYADTSDLVPVDIAPIDHDLYRLPGHDGWVPIETHRDTIHVKGGSDETVETRWTFWGPIIGTDARERPIANHWVAYDPAATNLNYVGLETAHTVAEAVAVAHESGIPAHNFLVADRAGAIAWTIVGKFPRRVGFDGRLPVEWGFGDRSWDGFVPPAEVPTIVTPPSGRLWTANNRIVGGAGLEAIGDGGYALSARAVQVRDDLAQLEHAKPRDLLAIQTDDRALFLARWRQILLDTLTPEAIADHRERAELRRLVENWQGRASVDSIGYRLVRAYRLEVANLALDPIFASCVDRYPAFDWHLFHYEPAVEALLKEKPRHLLDPVFPSWEALQLAAADAIIADLHQQGVPLDHATWGARNTAHIVHPFSHVLPGPLSEWLNMPADPLPGDANMPRIQTPTFGASMRLVVSPGHEDQGIFEMPGGECGNPLSPFYRAGHEAWVHGEPTPLLPGKTLHTLVLTP